MPWKVCSAAAAERPTDRHRPLPVGGRKQVGAIAKVIRPPATCSPDRLATARQRVQRIGGDAGAAPDIDDLELAPGDELVDGAAAHPECGGGVGNRHEEPGRRPAGGRRRQWWRRERRRWAAPDDNVAVFRDGSQPDRAEAVHEGGVDPAEHHRDPVRLAGERGRGHFVPRERAGPVSARRGGGKVGGRRPHPWPDGPRSPLPRGPLDRSPRCVTAGSPGADHWQTVRGDRRGRR